MAYRTQATAAPPTASQSRPLARKKTKLAAAIRPQSRLTPRLVDLLRLFLNCMPNGTAQISFRQALHTLSQRNISSNILLAAMSKTTASRQRITAPEARLAPILEPINLPTAADTASSGRTSGIAEASVTTPTSPTVEFSRTKTTDTAAARLGPAQLASSNSGDRNIPTGAREPREQS